MAEGAGRRDHVLQDLRGRRFERIPFHGLDAIVIRVPEDATEPPPAVQDRHASRQPWRILPVEGAHHVKWPYAGGHVPDGGTVEPGGWDHEHCDGCNGHVNAGQWFWQSVDEPCTWLCGECHQLFQRLEGTEPDR